MNVSLRNRLSAHRTRLIARTRDGMMPGRLAPLKFLVAEPAHCIMEIGVLRGVKARASRCSP